MQCLQLRADQHVPCSGPPIRVLDAARADTDDNDALLCAQVTRCTTFAPMRGQDSRVRHSSEAADAVGCQPTAAEGPPAVSGRPGWCTRHTANESEREGGRGVRCSRKGRPLTNTENLYEEAPYTCVVSRLDRPRRSSSGRGRRWEPADPRFSPEDR
jgi:hypothetical protein